MCHFLLCWTTFLCSRKMALRGARLNVQMFALEIAHASFRHNRMSIEPLTFNCNILWRPLKQKGDENFLQHMFRSTFQVKKENHSLWLVDGFSTTQNAPGLPSTDGERSVPSEPGHCFFKQTSQIMEKLASWLRIDLKYCDVKRSHTKTG